MMHAGLDISDRKLRLITLSPSYRRMQLHSFAEIEVPLHMIQDGAILDRSGVIKLLQELPKHSVGGHWAERLVHVGLPEQRTCIATVPIDTTIMEVAEKETLKIIPFKAEDIYYDIQINRAQRTASIAAGQKDFINDYLDLLETAGFSVVGLHTEAEAMAQALLTNNKSTGVIVIDLGLARTTIVFSLGNTIYFSTSYPSVLNGHGMNEDHFLSAMQQTIQYYTDHFAEQQSLDTLMLCGSGAALPQIDRWVEKNLGVTTVIGNPLHWLKPNHLLNKLTQPLGFTTAIGLALHR